MATTQDSEPLVGVANEGAQSADANLSAAAAAAATSSPTAARRHLLDVLLMSAGFFFVFSSYSAVQNLEAPINNDAGTTSLGVIYSVFTCASIVAPAIVRHLRIRRALVLGMLTYALYVAANFYAVYGTLIPSAVALGIGASMVWVCEGGYVTGSAYAYAAKAGIGSESAVSKFNGIFWAIFQSTQIVGNFVSWQALSASGDQPVPSQSTLYLLFGIFTACTVVGALLMLLLRPLAEQPRPSGAQKPDSIRDQLLSNVHLVVDPKMAFLVPLLVYSGFEQAFIWGDFTNHVIKPSVQTGQIGLVMMAYGAVNAIFSLSLGRVTRSTRAIVVVILLGFSAQIFAVLYVLLGPIPAGDYGPLLGLAVAFGFGDATFNTQISNLLSNFYPPPRTEAAYGHWTLWRSLATAINFFAQAHMSLPAKCYVVLATNFLAIPMTMASIFVATRRPGPDPAAGSKAHTEYGPIQ